MNRYEMTTQLGDGTYGSVIKGINKNCGTEVAIKRMKKKYTSWKECMDLREVRTLRELSHRNIVKLHEVIREDDSTLCFVFEHCEANLYEVMKHQQNLFHARTGPLRFQPDRIPHSTAIPEHKIRSILYQVLQALSFMHQRGYFHRDIKPENILVKRDVVKVADLGLAREVRSCPPYTDYVSTRWYRAPEVLLRSTHYNSPIDMFAMGCILPELYSLQPLFPGSSEIDQIDRIFAALGAPTPETWPEGVHLAKKMNLRLPQTPTSSVPRDHKQFDQIQQQTLKRMVPHLVGRPEAMDMMRALLVLNPMERLSAKDALLHPYFKLGLGGRNGGDQRSGTKDSLDGAGPMDTDFAVFDQSHLRDPPKKGFAMSSSQTESLGAFPSRNSLNASVGSSVGHSSRDALKQTKGLDYKSPRDSESGFRLPFAVEQKPVDVVGLHPPEVHSELSTQEGNISSANPSLYGFGAAPPGLEVRQDTSDQAFPSSYSTHQASQSATAMFEALPSNARIASHEYAAAAFSSPAASCGGLSRIGNAGIRVLGSGSGFPIPRALSSGTIAHNQLGNSAASSASGFGRRKF